MGLHVALLRAINVGGRNRVGMADLRAMFEAVGFAGARTLLQSGNVVFAVTVRKSAAALEALLEKEAAARLGVEVAFVVRTTVEWQTLIDGNPFTKQAKANPSHVVVMCLKAAPTADAVDALRAANMARNGRETLQCIDRDLYIVYPDGIARSKLTNAVIERHLATTGTARNWNTVLKLQAVLETKPD